MNIPYIITADRWTIFLDGKPITISKDSLRYSDITNAILNGDEEKARKLLQTSDEAFIVNNVNIASVDGLKIVKDIDGITKVSYNGYPLHGVLEQKLVSMWKAGCTDFTNYCAFLKKIFKSSTFRVRTELYSFLSYAELPINKEGNFIAYKAVDENYYSYTGNTETRVILGKVNSAGHILNAVNETIEIHAGDVDNDANVACSTGLHVGSYKYASGFMRAGGHIMAVEVNPEDVISVPKDSECQKCRVSKYRVLNEVVTDYKEPTVTVDSKGNVTPEKNKKRDIKKPASEELLKPENIQNTREAIDRNIRNHGGVTTIKQLCGSVGRKDNINTASMLEILLTLGFNVNVDNTAVGNSTVS